MKTIKSLKLNQINALGLGKREARFITGGYAAACGSTGCICACGLYQIFDNCKYVILEASDDCLIDRVRFLFLTKQYIIVVGRRDCFVFDRDTGKFLRGIGKCGEGPNEYSSYIRHAFIDEVNDHLTDDDNPIIVIVK